MPEIDAVTPLVVPFLHSDRVLRARLRGASGRDAGGTTRRAIPPERCPKMTARAEREGLRAVARDPGASYETVRSVLRAT